MQRRRTSLILDSSVNSHKASSTTVSHHSKTSTQVNSAHTKNQHEKADAHVEHLEKRMRSPRDLKMDHARLKVLKNRQKILAEQADQHAQRTQRKVKKKFNWKKLLIWIAVILAIVALWKFFDVPGFLLAQLEQYPALFAIYQAIAAEVEARSLLGLLYASFFGGLFFLSLPIEAIFVYYLGLNYYVVQLVTVAIIGNMLAMIVNYGIGRLVGERVIRFFMKKNYEDLVRKFERAGALIILIGNIIPFPIEPLSVVLGAIKYRFKMYIFFTLLGKLIKFALLAFGYMYVLQIAAPYLDVLSWDFILSNLREVFFFWE